MAGIFKSYDIRGIVPTQLTTGEAYRIGKATARHLKAKVLAVGRDARLSSPDLAAALTAGIVSAGCDVLDLGLGPTPLSYFAAGFLGKKKCQGAVQTTASHNPPEYGGFKFTKAGAEPMSYDQGLNEVEKLFLADQPALAVKAGRIRKCNLLPQYIRHLRGFARLGEGRPLKVAIDTANGVMGAILPALLKGLPLKVVPLYWKPDGRFPNHPCNPMEEENIAVLKQTVVAKRCDLGIAFDGDGDRCVFVDERGNVLRGDTAGGIMVQELLKNERPGTTVLYDVRSSKALSETVTRCGGRAVETMVGHSHIKAGLRREGAVMAAELSGHFYFRDFFYSDSGETAFFLVLSLLARSGQPLSELRKPLECYHHSGEVNFEVHDRQKALGAVEARYAPQAKKVSKVDGISIDMGSWWFNLRPSNTEPVVRLNLESLTSQAEMEARKAEVVAVLQGG